MVRQTAKNRKNSIAKKGSVKQQSRKQAQRANTDHRISKIARLSTLRRAYIARRPHRSFRRTFRRDYVRSLQLPGYITFTNNVWKHLYSHKNVFGVSILVFSLISAALVGVASQEVYSSSVDILKETSTSILTGGWGELGKGTLLLASIASGNFDSDHSDVQQVYAFFVFMLIWLSTVWLLRGQLAGNAPTFRDSLYNSAAPLVSTMLVALLFAAQLVPAAIGIVAYQAGGASLTGVIAMIVFMIAFLLVLLTLYWITSTFIALIIVTLPGMYPWRAIRIAGDLVVGRRIRILTRFLWGVLCMALFWGGIMISVILLTLGLQSLVPSTASWPIVPMMLVIVSSAATIFMATYCYLLYRRIVDDDTSPA